MCEPLNAVILAGGEGTRLRPLTDSLPKPMLPILDTPCIKYLINSLSDASIDSVYLTCGYKSEDLIRSLSGVDLGIETVFETEETPAGTAGAVKLLEDKLTETFIVASGDVLADINVASLLKEHKNSGAAATMALTTVENPIEFGIVGLDETGAVNRFKEKPSEEEVFSNLINAGIYVLNREVLDYVPKGEKFDFSKQLFPALLNDGKKIQGSVLEGMWIDIGRPADLLKANLSMAERRGTEGDRCNAQCKGYVASSDFYTDHCMIIGPSYIGKGVFIGSDALLSSSIVGHNSSVGSGSKLTNVFMRGNCMVGSNCQLDNVLLGEGCTIPDGTTLSDTVLGDNQTS